MMTPGTLEAQLCSHVGGDVTVKQIKGTDRYQATWSRDEGPTCYGLGNNPDEAVRHLCKCVANVLYTCKAEYLREYGLDERPDLVAWRHPKAAKPTDNVPVKVLR